MAGMETGRPAPPPAEVRTVVEIDAPADVVWRHVVTFSELTEPPAWFFRLGIAYPRRATIDGQGVGALRRCEFSTGAFVEPITAWEEPSRLAFDVAEQPPPMAEWSPYRHVAAPHLDGYLRVRRGEFRLQSARGRAHAPRRAHRLRDAGLPLRVLALVVRRAHPCHPPARARSHQEAGGDRRSELTCLLDAAGGFNPMNIAARPRAIARALLFTMLLAGPASPRTRPGPASPSRSSPSPTACAGSCSSATIRRRCRRDGSPTWAR